MGWKNVILCRNWYKMKNILQKLLSSLLLVSLFTINVIADEDEPVKEERLVKLSGKVVDAETGEELTGVRFFFEGEDEVFYSDAIGAFDIETVVGAKAKLKVSYISYESKLIEVKDTDFFLIKLAQKK